MARWNPWRQENFRGGRQGALLAEINLEPTPFTAAYSLSLLGQAGDLVPRLL